MIMSYDLKGYLQLIMIDLHYNKYVILLINNIFLYII